MASELEASPLQLKHGADFILHGVLDFIVDAYVPIVDDIEDSVLEMEQRALDSFLSRADIKRLFQLRRAFMALQVFQSSLSLLQKIVRIP